MKILIIDFKQIKKGNAFVLFCLQEVTIRKESLVQYDDYFHNILYCCEF